MWSLYEKEKFLKPLEFSNGKTQEDIVKEVLDEIKKGKKIIFIKGVCGTGKSAIALNIARNLGKTCVVVPGKNLQSQYKKDYEGDKYLLKKNNEKLKISVITGRKNHKCQFLEDCKFKVPKVKKEVDGNLNDIFQFSEEELKQREEKNVKDFSAENYSIPCKIEIKEKNIKKIREYLKQNPKINSGNFTSVKDIKRMSIAPVCPYWSPVIPEIYEINFKSAKELKSYQGINGMKYIHYQRVLGCSFYEQFNSYIDSDVIVFNSMKYQLESNLGRKPVTEVEIIDECDEFLDSFSNQRTLNIDRMINSLNNIFYLQEESENVKDKLNLILKKIKKDRKIEAAIYSNAIIPLKETLVYDLLLEILNSQEFLDEIDEESYVLEIEEAARMFDEFFNETYISFSKREGNLFASLVTTNLEKRFKKLVEKNKIFVLMSGTLHSEYVLNKIFGLKDYNIIDAEVEQQGQIEIFRTGLERDFKYENFRNGKNSREDYLRALEKCVEISEKPCLVHVNAFSDLPSKEEVEIYNLKVLISREELREVQNKDNVGELIEKFKSKEHDVLFSTRSGRGIDFPGEQCKSIVFTKYPNPNVKDAFWKILKQTHSQDYWNFYKDKAKRELLQKIYRGLRFKEDHIFLLSPDERVLREFEKK